MDYKGPDNIYWLFSSSAQALAAFIGFLAAGFFFVIKELDNQVKKDSTLQEINTARKKSLFTKLAVLTVLTGLSIVLSLLIVFFNGYDYCYKTLSVIAVSLFNLGTIVWATVFVIKLINPRDIDHTATKLIKENKDLIVDSKRELKGYLKIGEFLERFVELEKIIRVLDEKYELSYFIKDKYRNFIPLNELFKIMFQRELIDSQTLRDLYEVNKVRNLAAHGQIKGVDAQISEMLSELKKKFDKINSKEMNQSPNL